MSQLIDRQILQGSAPIVPYDVVVVGAGPYGLSTAAHLQDRGLKIGIFGKPLSLWREHMPRGMLLLYRFVLGTHAAARRVASSVVRQMK